MLDNAFFHAGAHAVVVSGAFLVWWPVLGPIPDLPRLSPPAAMGYLFLQSLVPLIPASFLTFATEPVYDAYVGLPRLWGIDVLNDQRVAGLIMKIGGGMVLWAAITVIFFTWAGEEERAATRERLAVLVAEHPEWTAGEYATALGVSRVRVYQLLRKLHARLVWII